MINEIRGDITTAKGIIIHQVNCQGVMGAGVALAIKNKWPQAYIDYRKWWDRNGGPMSSYSMMGRVAWTYLDDVWIGHCFAQDRYGRERKHTMYDAIDSCLIDVVATANAAPTKDINFPLIGCVNGGGHWPIVREIIEHRIPDTFTKNLWLYP